MIRWLATIVIILVTLIVFISLFLSVDSLNKCSDSPSQLQGCQSADVIIAVSGGDTTARTQQAIDLYKNGWADKVLFSGAALDKSGPSNAEVMRQQALDQNVPSADVIIEDGSETTRQNANLTSEIIDSMNIKSAIVVTSGYHQKRTLLEFSRQSPDVEFRSHPSSGDRQWSVWWWTTPHGWYLAVSEVLKVILFHLGATR